MKRNFFFKLVRESKLQIAALSFLGVVASACGVYLAWVSKSVVDIATGQADGSLLNTGLMLAGIILIQLGLQVCLTVLHVNTSAKMRFRLQSSLFNRFLNKQKLSADRFHSGELVHRLSGDTQIVSDGVVEIFPSLMSISARIIFSFAALVMLDGALAALCVAAGTLMLAAAKVYRKKTGDVFKKSRESEGKIRSFIQESVQNLAVIKAFSVQSIICRQLKSAQKTSYEYIVKKNKLSIGANVCFYVAMTAGYYAVLGWGAWRIFNGSITFGTLTAVLSLTGDVTTPFQQLASLFPQYMSACASAERLEELDELPDDELPEAKDYRSVYDKLDCIALKGITFSYGGAEVLSSADAEFCKGKLTAVTGESGAGKSTLLNIMTGVLSPGGGNISLIAGDEVYPDISVYRRMFAYVPQDFLLLTGNVIQNITLFDETPNMQRLNEAVRISELSAVIDELPEGLESYLGEGGGRLSGGQRQRMAIARAIYSGAEVLLMDESTSALSDNIEKKILTNLKESGKTVVFVTHRRTAVALCDRAYRMEYGILERYK